MSALRRSFEIRAEWDGEAGVWWCSNDELPLTTEAPTFEQLVSRVLEIAPEIALENGLAAPGDEIELHVVAERVQSVPVVAAARMAATFDRELRLLPRRSGCNFVRAGKGSHDIWCSPITKRRFPVPVGIVSRHTANQILSQAGLPKAF
ncbi:MAG TPA: DUF1902 domain-containing protein [Stellaceae bacterium]